MIENKPEVDITKAAEDLANEKLANKKKEDESNRISELEAKLKEYEKKEQALKKAEEEKKKSEISKRLEELEKSKEELKKDFDEKLEKLSTRQTSGKLSDPKKALTREEYDANRTEYLSMYAKSIIDSANK